MRVRRILMTLCLLAAPLALRAALPQQMNYQGRLANSGGVAIPSGSTFTVDVLIYDAPTGGTVKWSETHSGVATTTGLFNIVLGSITPINLPFDQPYFLTINVNGTGEMTPRTPLTTAPYAFRAAYADAAQVSAPLSLTNSSGSASALHVANTNGGVAADFQGTTAVSAVSSQMPIYAKNTLGGGFLPAILGEASGTGVGIIGRNTGTGGAGSLGGAVTPAFYTGVGVYGGGGGTGYGVIGEGTNGVMGKVTRGAGVAVRADANGLPGAVALQVAGDATFDGAGNTTTFNSFVSFTAGTNLGATGLVVPLNLTGGPVFPGAVFRATNTADGYGVSGIASQPGGFAGGGPPDYSAAISAGVRGYTNVTNSVGVAGYSQITTSNGLGVMGIGMTGIGGFGRSDVAGAKGGDFSADGPSGLGLNVSAANGQGAAIYSQLIGMSVTASGASGTGIYSSGTLALDANGALAMRSGGSPGLAPFSQGRIYFDGGSNKFRVSESGGAYVDLLAAGGASAPLSLSSPSSATALSAYNANGGIAVLGRSNLSGGTGVLAEATVAGAHALDAQGMDFGVSATASAGNGTGVLARVNSVNFAMFGWNDTASTTGGGVIGQTSNGYGIYGTANGAAGVGVYGTGGLVGVSASASTGTGGWFRGVTGAIAVTDQSTGRALSAYNNYVGGASGATAIEALSLGNSGIGVLALAPQGAGASKGVVAQGGYIGVSAVGGASGTGAGVYAAGAIALDAQGPIDLRGLAAAPSFPSLGTGRIYFDNGSNRFRVSEDGSTWQNLLPSVGQYVLRAGDSMTGTLSLPVNGLNVGGSQLYTSASGIGVGTNAPNAALDVRFTAAGADGLRIQGSNAVSVPGVRIFDSSNILRTGLSYDPGASASQLEGGPQLSISVGGTERARFNSLGNLGLGIISPSSLLDLNGALTQRGIAAPSVPAAGQGRIYFDSGTNKFKVSENGGAYQDLLAAGVYVQKTGDTMSGSLTVQGGLVGVSATGTVNGAYARGIGGGTGLFATSDSYIAVDARNFTFTPAIQGINSVGGSYGVYGQSLNGGGYGAGVYGRSDSADGGDFNGVTGVAVIGTSTGGIFQAPLALVATGAAFGISATASAANGRAIYGRASSTGATVEFLNDNPAGSPLKVNNLKFPSDTGSSGQVLVTDGSSKMSWATAPAPTVPFTITGSSNNPNSIIEGVNTGTGSGSGIRGETSSNSLSYGVVGNNTSINVDSAGVAGFTGSLGTPFGLVSGGGMGVLGGSAGSGVGVFGYAPNAGGIAMEARGNLIGLSATASGTGNAFAIHAQGAGTNAVAYFGDHAAGSPSSAVWAENFGAGYGVYANVQDGIGVFGKATLTAGVGVWGKNIMGSGTAMIAEGGSIGLSATAASGNGVAIKAQVNSTDSAVLAINDNIAINTNAIYGSSTGSGTGIKGDVFSPGANAKAVYGTIPTGSGSPDKAYAVYAENVATSGITAGGAALYVNGGIKVNNALFNDASGSSGTWNVNGGSSLSGGPAWSVRRTASITGVTTIVFRSPMITANSILLFTLALASAPGSVGHVVTVSPGQATISFTGSGVNFTNSGSDGFNLLIIN